MAKRSKTLRPVRANAGVEAAYRRRMLNMIDEMNASINRFLLAAYKNNEPAIAQDASPADELARKIRQLTRQWTWNFAKLSMSLAKYFAQTTEQRSSAALRKMLREHGFTVKFQITPAIRDIMKATVHENVNLIKSIPEQYLTQVEGIVMRGVQVGHDLHVISEGLQHQLGVTRRRAHLIARDQSNKANAAFTRARHLELGIVEAEWAHSHGGHHPRPSHVKAGRDRVRYKIAEGWYDPDEKRYIQPGELINCRCGSRPILPGIN